MLLRIHVEAESEPYSCADKSKHNLQVLWIKRSVFSFFKSNANHFHVLQIKQLCSVTILHLRSLVGCHIVVMTALVVKTWE